VRQRFLYILEMSESVEETYVTEMCCDILSHLRDKVISNTEWSLPCPPESSSEGAAPYTPLVNREMNEFEGKGFVRRKGEKTRDKNDGDCAGGLIAPLPQSSSQGHPP